MTTHDTPRNDALDGIRGLAIILVIINHLRLDIFFQTTPDFIHPVISMVTTNGKIGVGMLFMLSGYLMSSIYPQITSTLNFYQKRYTRIFPALVAMCFSLIMIRHYWQTLPLLYIPGIVITTAVVGGGLWRLLQNISQRKKVGKFVFLSFFCIQIVAVIGYLLLAIKVPPAVFYQVLPTTVREVIFLIVNSTMTLPFGNYVPQLDGVYWSLGTELTFYLLYPLLCIPIVNTLKKYNSKLLTTSVLLLCFPFLAGIYILFQNVLGFGILQIHFAIYFIFGIVIAQIKSQEIFSKVANKISGLPPATLFLAGILLSTGFPLVSHFVPLSYLWQSLLWVVPVALSFIICIIGGNKNGWTDFLSQAWLVKIGQLSFSLYLTHTIAIEMMTRSSVPQNITEMLYINGIAVVISFILAFVLHHSLEKPYFNKIKELKSVVTSARRKYEVFFNKKTFALLTTVLLFLIWYAFRTPIALTAQAVNHVDTNQAELIPITTQPLHFQFTASENNFGMVLLNLKPLDDKDLKDFGMSRGKDGEESIKVVIKDGATVLTDTNYSLKQMQQSRFHPVGLPIYQNSQGRNIDMDIYLTSTDTLQHIALVNQDSIFRSIYFMSKKELLKNPVLLIKHVYLKISEPFKEKLALYTIVHISPLLLILFYLVTMRLQKHN